MTDYTELKSRLRNGIDFDDSKEAADAIESLQRQIAELSKDAQPVGYRYVDHNGHWCFNEMKFGDIAEPVFTHPAPIVPGEQKPVDVVPPAWTNLIEYVLQDDLHNRLTPRVVDIAYTAFMLAKQPNSEDGGNSDWFNDTKPSVMKAIAKLRKDLVEFTTQPNTADIEQRIAEAVLNFICDRGAVGRDGKLARDIVKGEWREYL